MDVRLVIASLSKRLQLSVMLGVLLVVERVVAAVIPDIELTPRWRIIIVLLSTVPGSHGLRQ